MIQVHVDVDLISNYELEYGVKSSGRDAEMFQQALPRMLEHFRKNRVKATFFVVGKDLEVEGCREFCRQATEEGHEIANHTLSHRPDFHQLSFQEKEREIRLAGDRLSEAAGKKVVGFRAPGYYLDSEIIEILIRDGYLYDSSVLPSLANLLMGTYISLRSGRNLGKVFGRKRYALASQRLSRIHSRQHPDAFLFEIPIATLPLLRLPVHSTFIYLLGKGYLGFAELLLKRRTSPWVYLFHGIDGLNHPDPELKQRALPLRWTQEERLDLIDRILSRLAPDGAQTTRTCLSSLDPANVPRSLLLSASMPPYSRALSVQSP